MALPLLAALPAMISGSFGLAQAGISSSVALSNNSQNLELSREALEAQKTQQAWANEQYLENRDYNRALQQQVFGREDTAISRATQDAVDAGFSPLTAIGQGLGSGQVISSSQAPGSMISNNQASLQNPDLSGIGNAGAMIATLFEGQARRDHESMLAEIKLAQEAKEAGLDRLHDELMKTTEHDFLRSQENQRYYHDLQLALQNEGIQSRLVKLQQSGAASLQESAQAHASQMAEDERIGAGKRSELIDQFVNIVAQGDSRFARWLKENQALVTISLQLLQTFTPSK